MTDPNFLHAGDHVHLGPGVTATRVKDPAVDLHDLPGIDVVLLSHYHEWVLPLLIPRFEWRGRGWGTKTDSCQPLEITSTAS